MILTLDGHSGAGKTTQAAILSKKLGIPVSPPDWFHVNQTIEYIMKFYNEGHIAMSHESEIYRHLMVYHSMPMNHRIIDDGLFYRFRFYEHDDFDKALDIFNQGMSLGANKAPSASFLLDIPLHIANCRSVMRTAADVRFSNISVASADQDKNKPIQKVWKRIEDAIPYFHIIDGTMPVDAVTTAILEKIKLHI